MLSKVKGNWTWKGQIVEELKGATADKALEWANRKIAALEANQRGTRQDPTNAKVKLDGNAITITIPDASLTFGKSRKGEGKNWIVASSHGNFPVTLPNGSKVKIGLNVYADKASPNDKPLQHSDATGDE